MRADDVLRIVHFENAVPELWSVCRCAEGFHCRFWTLDEGQVAELRDWQKHGGSQPEFLAAPNADRMVDTIPEVERYFGASGRKELADHAMQLAAELVGDRLSAA